MNTRTSDPNTSHEAEKSVTGLALSYRVILGILRDYGPMNDQTIIATWRRTQIHPASDSGIRSRRSELAATGLVIDSGERQRMDSGRMSIVWSIA